MAKPFSCRPVIVSVRGVSLRAETLKRGLRGRESAVKEETNFGHPSIGPLRYAAMMAGLGIIRKRGCNIIASSKKMDSVI